MPSDKRQRQDQGRLSRMEEERRHQQRSQRRHQIRNLAILLAGLLVVALVISLKGAGDDEVSTEGTTTTTAADGTTEDTVVVEIPAAGAAITGATPCPEADGSSERTTSFEQAPPTCIEDGVTYTATIATSEGDIVIELDSAAAPVTVNNFVVLARYHFYDGIAFHRIIPGFMDQAGDAVGPEPGQGGPGYTIPDELPTGEDPYPTGTLAMANTGSADTGGSQWFITVEGGGAQLSPSYTAFGHVVEGQDVVDAINEHGDAATNGTPTKVITITSVTITEG